MTIQTNQQASVLPCNTKLSNPVSRLKTEEGRKVVKAQDVVRMYENMIQNLAEVPQLPGLEEDEELAATTQARVTALRYMSQEGQLD